MLRTLFQKIIAAEQALVAAARSADVVGILKAVQDGTAAVKELLEFLLGAVGPAPTGVAAQQFAPINDPMAFIKDQASQVTAKPGAQHGLLTDVLGMFGGAGGVSAFLFKLLQQLLSKVGAG